ncbi:hypothetical protein CHU98_g833 [Xylaria longipes]|nr:hypothetical protein CHU98_g833 [Xylaria longipes]
MSTGTSVHAAGTRHAPIPILSAGVTNQLSRRRRTRDVLGGGLRKARKPRISHLGILPAATSAALTQLNLPSLPLQTPEWVIFSFECTVGRHHETRFAVVIALIHVLSRNKQDDSGLSDVTTKWNDVRLAAVGIGGLKGLSTPLKHWLTSFYIISLYMGIGYEDLPLWSRNPSGFALYLEDFYLSVEAIDFTLEPSLSRVLIMMRILIVSNQDPSTSTKWYWARTSSRSPIGSK